MWYRDCASSWYEALPVGNGRIGAMVFGAPVFDRIQINEETLWSGCPYGDELPYDMQKIQEIRDLITNRDYVSAQEKTRDFMPNNETAVYVSYGFVNIDLISDKTRASKAWRGRVRLALTSHFPVTNASIKNILIAFPLRLRARITTSRLTRELKGFVREERIISLSP
ncbi:MAG: glycoside hydrolase N-terminal domain-containing protein [Clostridia bacterium]|nr:glycoside hydrolase N-terminal domain-containing protein [Clostridia bacterium]